MILYHPMSCTMNHGQSDFELEIAFNIRYHKIALAGLNNVLVTTFRIRRTVDWEIP
jgi:hypothetical protein